MAKVNGIKKGRTFNQVIASDDSLAIVLALRIGSRFNCVQYFCYQCRVTSFEDILEYTSLMRLIVILLCSPR